MAKGRQGPEDFAQNAFSKKLENHEAAFSMYAMFYNCCRPHPTLNDRLPKGRKVPRTPAMASGLTDHAWTIEEMVETVLRSGSN